MNEEIIKQISEELNVDKKSIISVLKLLLCCRKSMTRGYGMLY